MQRRLSDVPFLPNCVSSRNTALYTWHALWSQGYSSNGAPSNCVVTGTERMAICIECSDLLFLATGGCDASGGRGAEPVAVLASALWVCEELTCIVDDP